MKWMVFGVVGVAAAAAALVAAQELRLAMNRDMAVARERAVRLPSSS